MKMGRIKWAAIALMATALQGQELPDKPGRAEAERLCKQCHEMARSISKRQDKEGWNQTMARMTAFGMKSTDQEFALVLEYLAANYPAEDIPKVNVNTARAIEMEAGLSLRRSQAAAVIAWREKNGPFKSLADLKKVPGLNAAHLDERKERIEF